MIYTEFIQQLYWGIVPYIHSKLSNLAEFIVLTFKRMLNRDTGQWLRVLLVLLRQVS